MQTEKGDLVRKSQAGEFDVIVHGCNCFCTMGAGIAKTIKQVFPAAFEADIATVAGDKAKLGHYTVANVLVGNKPLAILNAYTQYQWKGRGPHVDYVAVRQVFRRVKQEYTGHRIGYPAIGAGLAGGEWPVIAAIIAEELAGENHVFVEWQK
ncbi:macro domain-containing protein [Hymenobacter negativus]|uniref:Macro domain-containing protein n=1 Tax=Hymenobacter negativus TaxID=2795026 RepID=A0ABS3QLR7_9BACT|nr:macro domain-containing protein [Hymenobacter negativus]MBO2012214.1 macro domain-containing protein [Hymenobacter negativus]